MPKETVSFLNCFGTLVEAEYFAKHLIEPNIILHLYRYEEEQLYAVCTKGSLEVMIQALADEIKSKEKA